MTKPLVSVIIPTCNRPDLLPVAVDSVMKQTFGDFEIIIVDDGLERRAENVVSTMADSRITYIKHEKNKGCSAAKNTGIRNARGTYIALLDDDDIFLPTKLEKQIQLLADAPADVGFSFTGAYEVYDDRTYTKKAVDGVGNYHELALRNFSALIDSSMVYKKEVFDSVGVLDETYPTHTGAELIIRIAKKFRGVGVSEPLISRTMTTDHIQMGSRIRNRIAGREMLLTQYKNDFDAHPFFLAKHITQLAKFYRMEAEYGNARLNFWKAFRLQPTVARFLHYISMTGSGLLYRIFRKIKHI